MVKYQMTQDRLYLEDIGFYTAFGVRAVSLAAGICTELCRISDIFLTKAQAAQFVDLLNRCCASLVHLHEILDDQLAA